MTVGTATRQGHEPNALPHEVLCVTCPRRVTIQTITYHGQDPPKAQGLEATIEYVIAPRPKPFTFDPPDYHDFIRGLLLEVTASQGHAWLKKYELPSETTPHGRQTYRLPSFALQVGKVVWVCPSCEEMFKGHMFNIEQYLAEQQWILNNLGMKFKLSNSM